MSRPQCLHTIASGRTNSAQNGHLRSPLRIASLSSFLIELPLRRATLAINTIIEPQTIKNEEEKVNRYCYQHRERLSWMPSRTCSVSTNDQGDRNAYEQI